MAPGRASRVLQGARAISKRLVVSYGFDWVALIVLGLVAYGFTLIDPHFRAFSLIDLSISFPYHQETISVPVLAAACVLAPAVIIAGVVFVFVPGPAAWKRMSGGEILRIKLWELNVGWLGLAMAHATQFLLVQGMKNLMGKPRPNMLARCQPDFPHLQQYVVGGYGQDIAARWVLVDQKICTQSNRPLLVDGFRSFPSGHNSTAFAGMLYLTLYLASKFGIGFPSIPFHKRDAAGTRIAHPAPAPRSKATAGDTRRTRYRDEAAAPPTWTLILVYIPIGVAIYIGSTRYFDYYHHGFDVLAGTAIGLLSGGLGFRWYHGPLGRSAGWAWSPRSRERAFGIGVGTLGYVGEAPMEDEGLEEEERRGGAQDVELGVLSPSARRPLQQPQQDHPQIRSAWQREHYESLRSSAEDRGGHMG